MKEPFLVRVESKLERLPWSGCWVFTGYLNSNGYGSMRGDDKKNHVVHRYMYEVLHGVNLPNSKRVCHRCDVRSCVNPAHLFVGSDFDNHLDAIEKKRKTTKLSAPQVAEIKAARARTTGFRWGALAFADKFGVSAHTIYAVAYGKIWRH